MKTYVPSFPAALKGETVKAIVCSAEAVDLYTKSGKHFRWSHQQDCCETVRLVHSNSDKFNDPTGQEIYDVIESVVIGKGITVTTWILNCDYDNNIVFTWHGESNGYYSEDVSFELEVEDET